MDQSKGLQIKLEIIWWLFTFILAAGVLYPILSKINNYPFLVMNVVFVIIFVTFTRYVFLLKHTFIAKKQLLKLILIFLCIPVLWYIIESINFFQTFLDEKGNGAIVGELPLSQQDSMMKYIRSLLLFFGVGGVIITVIFAIRLVVSIWRLRNRGRI